MLEISSITFLARLIVLLVGLPLHEWAHAWSADRLGDDTPRWEGRLSLNPLAHLDILGAILILLTGFGWARPVPVDPYRMRVNPRTGMALSSFAGPASNLLLAMVCAIPFRLGLFSSLPAGGNNLATLLWLIADVSLNLAIFNLLPFYPLDGEKVLVGILPLRWGDYLLSFRPYSPYVLLALLFLLPFLGLDLIGILVSWIKFPIQVLLFMV